LSGADNVLLRVDSVTKEFARRQSRLLFGKPSSSAHRAVNDVSLTLSRGEILGLAGSSGSGKTTLARCIIGLETPTSGSIWLDDKDVLASRGRAKRELRRRMQMVFQDPYASLNPSMTVGVALREVGHVHHRPGADDGDRFAGELLERVGLLSSVANRKPRALSGGQRQRVAIARALAAGPELLIADEAVSALDVSVQAQLLNLFLDLRDELGVAILFVSHQLAVLAEVADRVAVMQNGQIVESGRTSSLFAAPQHEYTRALLAAHPSTERMT
jgi:peptide/nickel transport system ATP-binding protein